MARFCPGSERRVVENRRGKRVIEGKEIVLWGGALNRSRGGVKVISLGDKSDFSIRQ